MQFVLLILRKIIKIVATKCQISSLKCTKFNILAGAVLQTPPALGSLQSSPNSLAEFERLISKEGERERMGREEKGGERRPFWSRG